MSVQPADTPSLLAYQSPAAARPINDRVGDLLALAFATSVAMWAFGYVGHAPFAAWPSAPFVGLMLLCVIIGGFVAGRHTTRGILGGALVGGLSAILNLLILGSVIKDPNTGQIVPSHLLWIPMSILFQAFLGGLGALAAKPFPGRKDIHWPAVLTFTFALLTLLLIAAGGLVTGFGAGLAVPDWPNSYGSNMLLYPLKSMIEHQGATHLGIFYEHAHRLLGMFVGVSAFTGAIYLTIVDRRTFVRIAAWGVFVAVIVQGLLGALRVTGHFDLSANRKDQNPNDTLALVHGISAHVILAGFVILAVMCCKAYVNPRPAEPRDSASTDLQLAWLLAAGILIQSFIGGFVRHFNELVFLHITIAGIVSILALVVGMRAAALNKTQPILRRHGIALLLILLAQLSLGILALVVRTPMDEHPAPLAAIITTLHQTNAALLLATAVSLAMWTRRLLRPAETFPRVADAS